MVQSVDSRWNWFYRIAGAAALIIFALFLIGVMGIITADPQAATPKGWLTPFQSNWLIVLFKLNAGFSGVQPESLSVLEPLDIVIMVLFGTVFLALYVALGRTSKIWSAVAASLPFLGIVVLLITSTAGRSGLLVGGLILSAVILCSNIFSKVSAYVGIVASALLFFGGDIGTAIFSSSNIIAVLIGIGYVLWMIWLLLIGRRLFQLGHGK